MTDLEANKAFPFLLAYRGTVYSRHATFRDAAMEDAHALSGYGLILDTRKPAHQHLAQAGCGCRVV